MSNIDDLIGELAEAPRPQQKAAFSRFATPLLLGIVVCVALVTITFTALIPVTQYAEIGPLLAKWAFSLSLALIAPYVLFTLGKPGHKSRWQTASVAAPFVIVALMMLASLLTSQPTFPGQTWRRCLATMSFISPIAFAGAIMAVRTLAPTDLKRAGFVAGLFGGAVAMAVYAPFCPERGIPYFILFYCLPTLVMASIGYVFGNRLLRW